MAFDLVGRLRIVDVMTPTLRRVSSELERTNLSVKKVAATTGSYRNAQNAATQSVNNFSGGLPNLLGKLKMVAGAVVAVSTAFDGIKTAADFESSMSRVAALSSASAGDLAKLTTKAKELGASTVFSASQAAEGMQFLAMAGYKTNEIIAAMPGLLDAAAAGQTDLGTTADIVSNILSGFGIAAGDTGRVADVLTKAFTSANVDLQMLGYTMKYAAPWAKALGVSLEETAAAAGILGNAGIQAEQAGTTLRGLFARFAKPPKEAAEAFDKLGVKLFDSGGKMKSLATILEDLQNAMKGMTSEQKTALSGIIAGMEAGSGFLALMDAGPDKLRKFTKELENSGGTAGRVSKIQLDNFNGSLVELESALEGLKIEIFTPMLPTLRDLAEKGANAASVFNKWLGSKEAEKWGKTTKDVLEVVGPLVVGATTAWATYKAVMLTATAAQWAFNTAANANPIGLLVVGIGTLVGAGYLLVQNLDTVKEAGHSMWVSLKNSFATGVNWVIGKLNTLIDAMNQAFSFKMPFSDEEFTLNIPKITEVEMDYSLQQEKMRDFRERRNIGVGDDGSHYSGLDYVPFDGYYARLHKGERVMTAEENLASKEEASEPPVDRRKPVSESGSSHASNNITINVHATVREEADIDKITLGIAQRLVEVC
ncbi:phage tail tape measure protein, TP901 family, core region [Brevibacillus laterosporus GI-9]|uniref:phage tail tape measure protein n=1 Tax=Brevibacillus laterosporus TaxID=1465 RepID=UPI0002404B57|nr:phage tail tape measure protein [Brevibacillus laterosporus]CCF14212.1 phage tail tape measure protein, TP901 family, core region [Brevibacillus laterosporus GI-9]